MTSRNYVFLFILREMARQMPVTVIVSERKAHIPVCGMNQRLCQAVSVEECLWPIHVLNMSTIISIVCQITVMVFYSLFVE